MSNRPNTQLNFEGIGQMSVYTTVYSDELNNRWRIDVIGRHELAEAFTQQRGVYLEAKPLSKVEAEAVRELVLARAAVMPDPQPVAMTESPSAFVTEQAYPEKVERYADATEVSPELPGLEVAISLLELAQPGPYQVTFAIDPVVTQQNRVYSNSFSVKPAEANQRGGATANVTLTNERGIAKLWLDSPAKVEAVNNTASTAAPVNSTWTFKVEWQSGQEARFSLNGDFKVV